jgi:hypothetical protein
MTNTDDVPIACTLTGGNYKERLAWIARLNRDGLRSCRRDATSLELHYAADVRDRVHELVRQEAECCAFLAFAVDESPDAIRVTITVPARAQDMADQLFEPFLPAGDERSAPTCVQDLPRP